MSTASASTASPGFVRVAIVTGAAQGLGLAIALRLADDGLDVALNDIAAKSDALQTVVAEIVNRGRRAVALPGDVSSEADVVEMIASTVRQLGGLDVMVANAGVAAHKSLLDTSVEDWDRIMSINARGVMLCYKYAALQMIQQGRGGRIIGASSNAGKQGRTNLCAYSASKFAVRGLTQTAALEFASHKITVNAYAPGFIITPLADHPDDALNGGKVGSTVKKLLGYAPDDPEAGPDVVASLVSYLAKPESYFITGQTLLIDGGLFFD